MPGFGDGPFGEQPCGEWAWSERVLWDLMPEIYRSADPAAGGYLRAWTEALRPSFERTRHAIRDLDSLRDALTVRTQYDDVDLLRLGRRVVVLGDLEQRGVDGTVAGGQFSAATARFSEEDRGKTLIVASSTSPDNNRSVIVATILSPTTIVTTPPLTADSGIRWELRTTPDISKDQITVEVRSGDVSEINPSWVLDDGFATFEVTARRQFWGEDTGNLIEREGTDGIVDSSGRLVSDTVRLTPADIGRIVVIAGSETPENNARFAVSQIIDSRTAVLSEPDDEDATVVLAADIGPLEWTILRFAELDLNGNAIPRGMVEQEGRDLEVASTTQIQSLTAAFSSGDIGKFVLLRGSATNDGVYRVLSIDSPFKVVVDGTLTYPDSGSGTIYWELRTPTAQEDLIRVEVHPPPLITWLAQDFGIEVDARQSEKRQRSWVRNVSRWIGRKGTELAYQMVAGLSGFELTASALYRITQGLADVIPATSLFEIGEPDLGRSGTDGSLTTSGAGRTQFSAPSALFAETDVGRSIRVRDAATASNSKLYAITSIIDAQTVEFRDIDTAITPDANNGALTWGIVRLYSSLPPTLPLYDELNFDIVKEVVESESGGAKTIGVDRYCWEEDWSSDVPVSIISVSTPSPGVHTLTVVHRTGAQASATIGSGVDGEVAIVADAVGDAGNSYTVQVVDPSPTPSVPLSATLIGFALTVTLATDGGGALDPSANTATLVEGVINVAAAGFLTATASGTGSDPLTAAEGPTSFSGGKDEFTQAPEAVVAVGRWRITDSATVVFFLETVPAPSDPGPPPEYTCSVRATQAPATGDAVLSYACAPQISCGFCAASKVLAQVELGEIASETGRALEQLWERLLLRLDDVTPAHVELIVLRTQQLEASLSLSAEIEAGLLSATLYAPLTAYFDEVPADAYPLDTVLTAEVEPVTTILTGRGTMYVDGAFLTGTASLTAAATVS